MPHPSRLLIVAVSGRALAQSAGRAGYRPVVLDLFADRDTRAASSACRPINVPGTLRIDATRLLDAARRLAPGADLVYGSGFEGRPALLDRLSRGRALYGNSPATVASVRDPDRFFPIAPPARNLAPGGATHATRPAAGLAAQTSAARPVAPAYFPLAARRRPEPTTTSASNRATHCPPLFSRTDGARWCWASTGSGRPLGPDGLTSYGGAVGGLTLRPRLRREIEDALDALVAETGLVGLNGLDFILRREEWLVLELNPRPTATFELYDLDYPGGLLQWHLRACGGELPLRAAVPRAVRAHAVVHADAPTNEDDDAVSPLVSRPADPRDPLRRRRPDLYAVHATGPDVPRTMALLRRRLHAFGRSLGRQAA